ncbi:NC domain protein [Clostridium sp. MCC353]|uniref:lecithin retinol acyltransferase family protein n=1 Tax=Clostridium sp. MCC353 TaxID=2592646 RepID=UPI001C00AC03|nr:lecithin retinol acyltransferase family protein [Clostridium sp. MCC353]MBT9777857.1 NC domain protein [Clostridium sp. MCC353]
MDSIIARPPVINVDFSEPEIWVRRRPEMGDHIRVMRAGGLYAHHGVYVSDDEIIHFTGAEDDSILDWSKPEVIRSDLDYFLKGGTLEVKEYTEDEFNDLYSPEQIVLYARACLGDKGYHLAFNNCEHFANVCTLGRFRSNQVERVLSGKLPNEEGKELGFLEKIGNAIKNFFGGGSSGGSRSVSTYEPDKVKIAEIESDTKIRLAHMENDRIELMKQARMDMLQFETESRIALEQAKAQGLTVMAQTILTLQEKLNEVAEKRLLIIEKGSLQIIKDIETFYDELGTKIQEDDDRYNTEKLPELLSILEKYEEGSPSHKIYMKRIEEDMALQAKHYAMQIEAVSRRQSQIIDGFLQSKEHIIEQTGQITAGMLEAVQNQVLELNNSAQKALDVEKAALPGGEKPALADGIKCFS